jgi:hypothetical protein
VDSLREEIRQAQAGRADLVKWKLVLVGGIGSAGLGIAGSTGGGGIDLVLCAIPGVCVYVDLVCLHLTLRMLVIGRFLAAETEGQDPSARLTARYEAYAEKARSLRVGRRQRKGSAFDLEEWALPWSTVVLSLLILIYGLFRYGTMPLGIPFLVSGVGGIVITVWALLRYRARSDALSQLRP